MKYHFSIAALAIHALFPSTPAFGQAENILIDPTPARFLVRAPDYNAISDKWTGGLEMVQWTVNKLAEKHLQKSIKAMVEAGRNEAIPIVEWTGQGVLFEIRVATNPSAERAGWFVGTIVGESAIKIGVGKSPEQALFAHYSKDTLQAGAPVGFTVDPTLSGFFWIEKNAQGRIVTIPVARGTTRELVSRMTQNYGDLELKYQIEKMSNKDAWIKVANSARQKLADRQARKAIDSALKLVTESELAVANINQKLQAAIEKEAKLSSALSILQIMKTVLDLGSMIQVAIKETGGQEQQFKAAKTPEGVVKIVNEIQNENITMRKTYEIEFNSKSNDLQNALDNLWKEIKPANPPADAIEPFKIKRVQ